VEGSTPIRILYVITDLALGGVPLHLYRLARAMRERGHDVPVASLASGGPVAQMLQDNGFTVYGCDGRGGWDVRVLSRLRCVIEATRPDLIHTFLFHANVAGRQAGPTAGVPSDRILCEIQTVEVERRWHLWVDRFTHRRCRFTIGNSPSVIDHLSARAGIPRERLRLVKGGIDPVTIQQASPLARHELGLQPSDRIVLWVGRLDPVKGLTFLLDAFVSVAARSTAHLLLAGGGPLRRRIGRQIQRRGLSHRVHLLGPRRDVPPLLKTADVFVLPSRTEGLPNALLEAMAAGCAIVTTDVPGCRDLIRHGREGWVVPFRDVSALSSAILRLLEDQTLARRLGDQAREEVTRSWHIHQTFDAYASLYSEVASSARG
jgi:glycosyltransferase involved in cell wall biosynthesis